MARVKTLVPQGDPQRAPARKDASNETLKIVMVKLPAAQVVICGPFLCWG
jgi:hypothetical protein